MIGKAIRMLAAAGLLLAAGALPARAQSLVADLSEHVIAITTGFIGTELLLFGAIDGDGDVVVVLRGPTGREVVRRKGRFAGIWVNERDITFEGVPSFYSIASSRPLQDILSRSTQLRHQIGFDTLRFAPEKSSDATDAQTLQAFRDALIRNKQRADLYVEEPGKVVFLGNSLFRTTVYFPSNVPTGSYTADVYLVQNGNVVSAQSTPLFVSKVGFSAEVYDLAYDWPIAYGVFAVLIALLAGWSAALVFRRT